MTFSEAMVFLDAGERLARAGWNGRGMWIARWRPGTFSADSDLCDNCPALREYARSCASQSVDVGATIIMKAADGSIVLGWLASQTDMAVTDWELVDA